MFVEPGLQEHFGKVIEVFFAESWFWSTRTKHRYQCLFWSKCSIHYVSWTSQGSVHIFFLEEMRVCCESVNKPFPMLKIKWKLLFLGALAKFILSAELHKFSPHNFHFEKIWHWTWILRFSFDKVIVVFFAESWLWRKRTENFAPF